MADWSWRKTVRYVALSLILVGVAPISYWLWWGKRHNLEPLSMPLPLRHGEYVSPLFATDIDGDYQVEIYFLPWDRSPLQAEWRCVDGDGRTTRRGSYRDQQPGGNSAVLGRYHAKVGEKQRIVVDVLRDVTGEDTHPQLHVGLPDVGLGYIEGYLPLAFLWAAVCTGLGVIALAVLFAPRSFEPRARSRT